MNQIQKLYEYILSTERVREEKINPIIATKIFIKVENVLCVKLSLKFLLYIILGHHDQAISYLGRKIRV